MELLEKRRRLKGNRKSRVVRNKYRALIYKAIAFKRAIKSRSQALIDEYDEMNYEYTNPQEGDSGDGNVVRPRSRNPLLAAWTEEVMNMEHYVEAAFRSSSNNQVFMFIDYEYFVINNDPASPSKDYLVKSPSLICDGFPTLFNTHFHTHGVDAAFGCHGVDEAYLFSGMYCAKIRYDLDTHTGVLIEGRGHCRPNLTQRVFPFVDEHQPIKAAFASTLVGEAYLFQSSQYVLFNYSKRKLIKSGPITDAFPCLRNTIFSSDIGSAFASHIRNQAYLFKDNSYVLIRFNSRNPSDSRIIVGPEEIVPNNWPSLRGIVPYDVSGRDMGWPKTWEPVLDKWGNFVCPLNGP